MTTCCSDTSGWAKFAGGSERGSRYTVIDKATTFYGAQERCQKLGGYVVHINSLREQLFIEDFLTQLLERRQDGRQRPATLLEPLSVAAAPYGWLMTHYGWLAG